MRQREFIAYEEWVYSQDVKLNQEIRLVGADGCFTLNR